MHEKRPARFCTMICTDDALSHFSSAGETNRDAREDTEIRYLAFPLRAVYSVHHGPRDHTRLPAGNLTHRGAAVLSAGASVVRGDKRPVESPGVSISQLNQDRLPADEACTGEGTQERFRLLPMPLGHKAFKRLGTLCRVSQEWWWGAVSGEDSTSSAGSSGLGDLAVPGVSAAASGVWWA